MIFDGVTLETVTLGALFAVAYAGFVWAAWRIGWDSIPDDDTTNHEPTPDPRPALGRAIRRARNENT
jgi:hypothetical protein